MMKMIIGGPTDPVTVANEEAYWEDVHRRSMSGTADRKSTKTLKLFKEEIFSIFSNEERDKYLKELLDYSIAQNERIEMLEKAVSTILHKDWAKSHRGKPVLDLVREEWIDDPLNPDNLLADVPRPHIEIEARMPGTENMSYEDAVEESRKRFHKATESTIKDLDRLLE
jgi:hypothetical protein